MVTAHPDPSQGSDRMDWTLEVVVLPVSDIDRSIKFYRDQLGFELDHDTANEHMHVAQLTHVAPAVPSWLATSRPSAR